MTTSFKVLCTFEIGHTYYGGLSQDFLFVMPDSDAPMLRRGRLIVKMLAGRLHVLYEVAAGGGPLVSAAGAVLRIGLRLVNPFFVNVTTLAFSPGKVVAVYANRADATQLDAPTTATATGAVFAHTLTQAARPVDVALKTASGTVIAGTTVTAATDQPSVSFDLTGYPPGAYTVAEEFPGGVKSATRYYVDPDLSRDSLFGIVEIAIAQAFYNAPPAFKISFEAREETLKYYVVASEFAGPDIATLKVKDIGFDDDHRDEVKFAPPVIGPPPIPGVPPADDHTTIVLFQSDAPIRRRAQGRQHIQLTRNGNEIIPHLPQPGADRPNAELIVHVTKQKP